MRPSRNGMVPGPGYAPLDPPVGMVNASVSGRYRFTAKVARATVNGREETVKSYDPISSRIRFR